jgi:hypothetical protein
MTSKKNGLVYIMKSECIRVPYSNETGWICPVKIGSSINWESRIGNLDGAVPIDFKVYMIVECDDCRGLEYEIHKKLSKHRYSQHGRKNTEFFTIDVEDAKKELRGCALEFTQKNGLRKPKIKTKILQLGRSSAAINNMKKRLFDGRITFVCNIPDGGVAYGHFKDVNGKHKFLVKAGSGIRKKPSPSFSKSRPLKYYAEWYDICQNCLDENGNLKNDYLFESRAAATSVVCASIRNGDREWIDQKNGYCLGEYFGRS